ncbi:MAG: ATP-binding protein [Phaeospirillum sp.]|nr:ATP-binding protein [Phaeospirillum sp.]
MSVLGGNSIFNKGIGSRLLLAIVLFSSIITLALTVFQLYLEYRDEVENIQARFNEVERSYLASLGGALWSLDVDQIQLLIEGIRHLPDMQYLEVREVGRVRKRQVGISVGERGVGPILSREYPILYAEIRDREAPQLIGALYVEATLSGVYGRLTERAMSILITQGVKTFLVSAFTLFIVHRLVTRHLIAISGFLRGYTLGAGAVALRLSRRPPSRADELDDMTAALNVMSTGLVDSVHDREQTLRELRRQEAALDRAYRHFTTHETAAKLAHEIKQPLACLTTYTQGLQSMVLRGEVNPEELPQLVDRMVREVQRVREIIAISQSQIEHSVGASESLSVGDLLRDVIPLLYQICDDHGVAVRVEGDDLEVFILGNRVSLQQVLVNLVRNACEAMTSQPEAGRRLRLSVLEGKGKVAFTIHDSGPGFPAAILQTGHALFASAKRTGSGFGLPIVTAILATHGGRLEISNDEDGGGRVVCSLPKA